jgi:hypothetical protein
MFTTTTLATKATSNTKSTTSTTKIPTTTTIGTRTTLKTTSTTSTAKISTTTTIATKTNKSSSAISKKPIDEFSNNPKVSQKEISNTEVTTKSSSKPTTLNNNISSTVNNKLSNSSQKTNLLDSKKVTEKANRTIEDTHGKPGENYVIHKVEDKYQSLLPFSKLKIKSKIKNY